MKRSLSILAALAMAVAFGAGCHGKAHISPNFGNGLHATNEHMIVDPSAGTQAAHEGLDPRSAEHTLDNYSKGQKAQEHPRPRSSNGGGLDISIGDALTP